MEVNEDGNNRSSFELRLDNTGLLVQDLQLHLQQIGHCLAAPDRQFQALYQDIGSERVTRAASGIHRDGQPFLTLYYGNRWVYP
jgi:hypothetical protein